MILALDISQKSTGFAYGTSQNLDFGTRCFDGVSGDLAYLGRCFRGWVAGLMTEHEPEIVVIERPFLRNESTSYLLGGMVWEAHRAAEIRNIEREMYAPITIKKFITGSGKSEKSEIVKAVRERGYPVTNDDEADAVALLLLHEDRG